MVTLAEFLQEHLDRVRQLAGFGWKRRDVGALLEDWSSLGMSEVLGMTGRAGSLTRFAGSVDEARAWLRVLFEYTGRDRDRVDLTSRAQTWLDRRGLGPFGYDDALVGAYVQAAGGDGALGRLAFLAGAEPDELADMVAAGEVDRDGLATLAGLRGLALR